MMNSKYRDTFQKFLLKQSLPFSLGKVFYKSSVTTKEGNVGESYILLLEFFGLRVR